MEIWLDRLRGAVPTQLPIAIKDSLKQPLCDAERQLELSGSIDRLSTFIDSEANVKIDTIVLGAWALLLARYSCTEDVLFGTNIYSSLGRSEEILPIRVRIEDDRTLLPWLQELESQPIDGDLPTLAQICEGMQVRASDLLTSVLLFTRSNDENLEPINYPLVLKVVTGERLELKLAYDSQRFELAAIDRLLGHLQTLIEGMVANLHQTLAEVPMLTAAERHQLLVEWNDTQVDYPHDKTIHQVFTEQVARTPDEIAVILPALDGTPDLSLTYRQLNDRSNNLAIALQEMGVETETPVAMCLERSIESIVAILGILKAGGVYVPLDPAYPSERLALMLADIPSPVLLTQSHLVDRLPSHAGSRVVCLDVEMPQPRFSFREAFAKANALRTPTIVSLVDSTNAENLAYINFTSGSTGRPKGVAIPHRAVLRLVLGSQFTPLDRDRTLLQLAPTSFDAATLEIWGALLHGGRCILFPGNGIPDVRSLGTIISNYKITTLWLTAALFNTIVAEAPETLKGVSEILTGGEALSPTHIRQAQSQLVDTQLINGYGPTESTTFTCCYRIPNPIDPQATSISIGRPIANTQVYILDAALQPVPIGIPGELYIGGDGLARGYIDRPELTAERFVAHPFSEDPNAQLYKTGDLVRYLADGNIEFMGRSDDQVKIRGYRIELGEIETKLSQHETVREAIVIVRDARLVAYITAAANQSPQPHELKAALRATLPEYMVPNAIVVLAKMPLTANGKADRRALPDLQMAIDPNFVAPSTATERTIAEIWGDVLSLERVGIEANFFDLGGTSLLGLQMVTRVQKQLNTDFRAVKLYQYPTIRTLARFLDRADTQNLPKSVRDRADAAHSTSTDVAIIGMVGRFPGANDVAEFWDNLCEGIDTNSWFTDAQIDPSIDPELRADPHYVRARGILADADMFDAAFFGISPREAEVMDPQARIFLELAHQALETVGYTPDRYPGQIGLYAGSGQNTYFEKHICTRSEIVDRLGEFQTMLANEKDFLTTRTSYKLGLTGPSLSINTACSTSLVAIIQAVRSLSDRHCDMALAGGISITTPQNRGYLYQEGGMLSPDGRCRPFDAHAGGTLFNSGAGIVVLKRVEDALADGDRIYAVIKGVGLNNDGADKVSFTAPSVNGQAAAIAMAHADCGCDPKTISYVETHGTATAMGDPIEIEALTLAFQQPVDAEQFCAIGSLKGNIGHVVAAAGVAGVIKTALALDRQQLPPSINFESPNPAIDFASSPFFVNTQLTPWQAGATPLRAGVSSFGVGGTNAHIILEQAPTVPASSKSRPCQLLVLSAKTAAALDKATANLQAYLAQTTENLADIAFTLQQGRTSFNHRRTIVCRDAAEAVAILETQDVRSTATRHTELRHPDVVFMFPGQGSQYVNMGENLYQTEPVFRDAVDRCAEILMPLLGRDLRTILYPSDTDREAATTELRQTQFTQPAIFTVEYALAQLWQSWGIKPAAAIGHSIGEFVAACLAGVFSLADGLKLIATRGRMMGDLPAGSMLSVLLPAAEVADYLSAELSIAAINGPSLCVVSGSTELIAALQHQLEAKEIGCKPLHTSHAFHSPMMEPILPAFAELAQTIELSPPQIPFVSTVTGTWITDVQATDYLYWTNHLRATVRFAEGIQTLWQVPERVLLEVGPRTTAATLARQQITDRHCQVAIPSLGSSADDNAEWTSIIHAIGQLWRAGVEIDWNTFYRDEYRHRTPLPTYPFDRHRYWIDPKPALVVENQDRSTPQTSHTPTPPHPSPISPTPMTTRKLQLLPILKSVLETTSGFDVSDADDVTTFLEMGLDSLSLTQVAIALKKQFKIKITFRNLLEDYPNLGTLADFLDKTLPADALPAPAVTVAPAPAPVAVSNSNGNGNGYTNGNGNGNRSVTSPLPIVQNYPAESILGQHLQGAVRELARGLIQGLAQELDMLAQGGSLALSVPAPAPTPPPAAPEPTATAISTPAPIPTKSSGPGAKIEKTVTTALTSEQQAHLNRIVARYNDHTAESKRQAQEHRRYLADPRTVSGFTPLLKEMVYQIVIDRSAGSKLWDVDGNEYVDITNGFGLNFFGWNPDFVTKAVMAQMEKGIEIGPQTPLAGRVAKSIVEFTGMERVAFCNTGSEAVMATLRLARTVTGRNLIATFNGDYHGTFDEVLYRQGPKHRTLPAAPGLMSEMFENLLVLDYGTPESLAILRERADELAGILVEPVRSRDPGFQPREFLQELRTLTTQSETALIFDEVVTGFRVHPGGAQAYFGIQADMATYGKVVGGGLPIGIVAGKAEYMDALDGGFWEFGNNSIPEVGVTFFAGTFVRHPMALAAAAAVLDKLKEGGPELQISLSAKVEKFVKQMRQHFDRVGAPIKIEYFSSFFYITYPAEVTYGGLLFYMLREKGVHIWEYRPCFFTLAHTDEDIEFVARAFKDTVAELQTMGFLPGISELGNLVTTPSSDKFDSQHPPQAGARLGKDPDGNLAWYIPDLERPGKYLQMGNI